MIEILSNYVPDFHGRKTTINGYKGYTDGETIYFIIPLQNSEEIYYEQKVLSDFLRSNGFKTIASPILSIHGQLTTKHNEGNYIVYQAPFPSRSINSSQGYSLAEFHRIGREYPYQPNYVSSYGHWKTLWINKVNTFESIYNKHYQERPVTKFQRLFIDTFPYIIGLSENAIQYLQESEEDFRFDDGDQATITFQRFQHQSWQQLVWSHDLVYDHPVRDVAEYIRLLLMNDDFQSRQSVLNFLKEYQQVRSFSIFGWRLLYARLIFPIHLFDYIEIAMDRDNSDTLYREYKQLLERQMNYERNLESFLTNMDVDVRSLRIPTLDWK